MTRTEALAIARGIARDLRNPMAVENNTAQALLDAVKAERERCVKIVTAYPNEEPFGLDYCAAGHIGHGQNTAARDIAQAIRQRGEPEHGDQG